MGIADAGRRKRRGESPSSGTTVRVALGASWVSLLLSGAAFVMTLDDELSGVEGRLACLELRGANDCGADGR